MKRETAEVISGIYEACEECEPGISTERLLATVAACACESGTLPKCTVADVVKAMQIVGGEGGVA